MSRKHAPSAGRAGGATAWLDIANFRKFDIGLWPACFYWGRTLGP